MTTESMSPASPLPPFADPAPAPPASPSTASTTCGLAVVSLVCGILGWTLLPMLGSAAAVVTGHLARAEIRASQGRLEGDGLALGGLVLGWVSIALGLLTLAGIALIVLLFGGLAAFLAASVS
jgi:hypothetical protein